MVMTMVTKRSDKGPPVRQIKASEFKAKCLKLIDEVAESGEPIAVTKRGTIVVRVVPGRPAPLRSLRGSMKGKIRILTPDGELPSAWDEETLRRWEEKLDRMARELKPLRKTKAGRR